MPSEAPACGDEKSAYPSKSDVGRAGIGLLDAGAAAEDRGGVTRVSRARWRDRVGGPWATSAETPAAVSAEPCASARRPAACAA